MTPGVSGLFQHSGIFLSGARKSTQEKRADKKRNKKRKLNV